MAFRRPEQPATGIERCSPHWPSAASRVVGTIGYPVSHSMSPLLHQAAFDALDLDWVSVAFPVAPGLAPQALGSMRALGIAGLSVTMPHKADVASAADELSPLAARLGAVNCVVYRDGVLFGDSTDGAGFLAALERGAGVVPAGRRCAVIGAGGAARAVIAALGDAGAAEVVVVNRTAARAEQAAELASGAGKVGGPSSIAGAEIVVHATPAGMTGVGGDPGEPDVARHLHPGQVVMDLVYVPSETALLRAAAERGAVTVGGIGMLVHQAALAIELWTGERAPVERMWDVAVRALGARKAP